LAYGLAYGLAFLINIGPAPTYRKPFDRRALAIGFVIGLTLAFAVALPIGLGHGLRDALGFWGLAGPAFGLVGILAFGLLGVGPERERVVVGSPTQAIRTSGWLGLAFGLLVAVVVGLTLRPVGGMIFGTTFGFSVGLATGLAFGLDALACHYAFRVWLRRHRLGPWDWPGFLHWASDRMLLRTNGASYEWIHLDLRDHLAHANLRSGIAPGAKLTSPN
jgi:hypothetical protein